jgi:hypothetical protein
MLGSYFASEDGAVAFLLDFTYFCTGLYGVIRSSHVGKLCKGSLAANLFFTKPISVLGRICPPSVRYLRAFPGKVAPA